jgi:hypothetical protein
MFLINLDLTLIAYQTTVYFLEPTLHFLFDQIGHSFTIVGNKTS